jgi:VanZ family protein
VTDPSPPSGIAARFIRRYGLAVAVMLLIAYGSLYPFRFHGTGTFSTDLAHFLASWREAPQSRGDVLANLLLYIPLGLTVTLALSQGNRGWGVPRYVAALLAILAGTALSLSIELAQFYDTSRVSAFSDFALNVVGSLIGAVVALVAGARLLKTSWPYGSGPAFARLLLLAWLGWRLYPYVPTLEIHRFWRSIQPVLFAPEILPLSLFRYAALWLSVAFLFHLGVRRSVWAFLLAMICFFAAKTLIIGQSLVLAELLGAALALALTPLVLGRFRTAGLPLVAACLMAYVILNRILPWQFAATPKPFQWIPFFGFLHGSQQVDAISFSEKFYLYGVMLLLLVRSGLSLWFVVALECILLFATSYFQTYMVGRSAEISDAILALMMGIIYAFIRRQYREDARPLPQGVAEAAPR